MPEDSYVRQKVMGCVMYGSPNQLRYYIGLPFMSSGANFTSCVLLDALQHADLRADDLRLQVLIGYIFLPHKHGRLMVQETM